jgi:predicted permease
MNLRDLRLRLRAVFSPRRVERELDDELTFHIEMETRKHVAAGLSPADARARARARFGSPALVAERCRDARGTAFVDASMRDVSYALRTFRRAPGIALTIVATVALGLGLVAVVFTIFSAFVFRTDAVQDPDSLFAIERPQSPGSSGRARFTRPEYERLREETGVFSDVCGQLMDITSRIDGRMMEGQLVTGNFFQVLGVSATRGRTLMPEDEAPSGGRPVMVISHTGWSRLFARDPNIVGRDVVVRGFRYQIVGVMPEGFRGLALAAPDYWAPLSLVGQFRPFLAGREDRVGIDVVGRLKPGMSRRTAVAGLGVWASGGAMPTTQREPRIWLEPAGSVLPLSPRAVLNFSPLFFAFGLILLIGCANVANLLLARAASRQREIGIRLSLGASRRRVVRQLLTESLVLAIASGAFALVISRIVLDGSVAAIMRTMPPELAEMVSVGAPATDWRVVVFLVCAAVISTICFGLLPALQATRLDLVRAMRGEATGNARPNRARNVLIVTQVTASALLLICASIFLRGALRASAFDPGLRTSDTVIVEIVNEPYRTAMVAAATAAPPVATVAASWPGGPLNRPRDAFASAGPVKQSRVSYRFVSPEYFTVLGIGRLTGRVFTQTEARANAAVAVVSDTTARQIWPNGDAIGQVLRLERDPDSATGGADEPPLASQIFTVIGVVRDVAGFRISGFSEAGVYVPATAAMAETDLIVRVHGDPELARRDLLERLTTIDPSMGQVLTLRTLGRLETYPLQIGFWLTVLLGGLALMLTLSGIFSVLSYLVAQRTKEIGVRMALGATTGDVTRLVLWQSLRLVGIGSTAGGALAWSLATAFMATPAAARIGGIVDVFDPLAYGGSLLCIVAACIVASATPLLRAARIDPIAALRQE